METVQEASRKISQQMKSASSATMQKFIRNRAQEIFHGKPKTKLESFKAQLDKLTS